VAPVSRPPADPRVRAWGLLDELVQEVYRATRLFPAEEREGLVRAIRQSAVAAAVRLASGGPAVPEVPDTSVLRASARLSELRYYLYLARRLRLIESGTYRAVVARHERAARFLDRLRAPARPPRAGPGPAR
jgi:four helix bundle protein